MLYVNVEIRQKPSQIGLRIRRQKLEGAIEALEELLAHARNNLYEVTEKDIYAYLAETKKVLRSLPKERKVRRGYANK